MINRVLKKCIQVRRTWATWAPDNFHQFINQVLKSQAKRLIFKVRKKPLKQLKFLKDVYLLMEFHNMIIIIYYYRQRRRRRSNNNINIIISRKMHQQRLQYIARMHVLHIFAKFNSWYMFIYLLTAFDASLALTRSLCNSIMVYLWIYKWIWSRLI